MIDVCDKMDANRCVIVTDSMTKRVLGRFYYNLPVNDEIDVQLMLADVMGTNRSKFCRAGIRFEIANVRNGLVTITS